MKHAPTSPWGRVAGGALAALGVVLVVVACGDSRPNAGASGDVPTTGTDCSTPQEGCACAAGTQAPCAVEAKGEDDFLFCEQGTRTCATGTWGTCVTDGTVSVSAKTLPPSGLRVQALGLPGVCAAGLNPCDPYCRATSDTPVGFDAGAGFTLRDGGLVVAGCGDAVVAGAEECDDGNNTSGDGCTAACLLEPGYKCPTAGMPCAKTTCGDGVKEGAEQCDDGNARPYDGCSPTCTNEAVCPTGECIAVCGDGLKFPAEACDDGNTKNGDGCSSTCTVEPGATCTVVTSSLPPTIDVPVVYRDFTPATNPDFEKFCCGVATGIVKPALAADGKPAFNATKGFVTSAASFNEWYHDTANNKVLLGSLTLTKQPDNSYVYDSAGNFFPLNGKGYGNYGTTGKNFHFTSELRYPFTFSGGEVLEFNGDDDVFVFINGKLAVDIGGVHGATAASITLNAANATALGLVVGRTYEIAVFQAERRTTESNYKLTLRGFVRARSFCSLPSNLTIVRDFEGVCGSGERAVWQLFRWRAAVPAGTSIAFRAATADTQAALPLTPAAAPATVSAGSATAANSPLAGPVVWKNDVDTSTTPASPYPISKHLKVEAGATSKRWLRVYMTFNALTGASPRLDEWQQLYDCVPSE